MTTKHTPTPYNSAGRYIRKDIRIIAEMPPSRDYGFTDADNENAAFIVRAVNSHESMVHALRAARHALEKSKVKNAPAALELINAALLQAKE